jgi:hypothetical protein
MGLAFPAVTVVREGQPDERIDGARIAIREVVERDRDQDKAGDETEDQTDLRAGSTRARVAVTVTNAGPRAADLPAISTSLANARFDSCRADSLAGFWVLGPGSCPVQRIAPGESRTVTVVGDAPDATTVFVRTRAEGPDLAYGDNETSVGIPAAPPFTLTTAASQRLQQGVTVKVSAARTGRARVTVAFDVRGRTVKLAKIVTLKADAERAVTVRATGSKLRSLRRAVRSGALTAQIAVRSISGKTPITATTKVLR